MDELLLEKLSLKGILGFSLFVDLQIKAMWRAEQHQRAAEMAEMQWYRDGSQKPPSEGADGVPTNAEQYLHECNLDHKRDGHYAIAAQLAPAFQ